MTDRHRPPYHLGLTSMILLSCSTSWASWCSLRKNRLFWTRSSLAILARSIWSLFNVLWWSSIRYSLRRFSARRLSSWVCVKCARRIDAMPLTRIVLGCCSNAPAWKFLKGTSGIALLAGNIARRKFGRMLQSYHEQHQTKTLYLLQYFTAESRSRMPPSTCQPLKSEHR